MSTPYQPYDPSQQQPGMSSPQGGYPQGGYPQGGYPPPPQGGYAPYPQQQGGYGSYPGPGGFPPSGERGYLQGGPVGFGEAVNQAVRNAFNYQARASRSAYWWFVLLSVIIYIILGILANATSGATAPLNYLVDVALIIVGLPLAVRRMHDQDKSGFWVLLGLIPVIGWIWFLILALLPGTPGPNRFG